MESHTYCSSLMLALLVTVAFCTDQGKLVAHADQADEYLEPHNAARSEVGVAPLTWDTSLENYARENAQSQAGSCLLTHSNGPYGENIYWQSPFGTPGDAVASWVNEKQDYDYESNSREGVCGHYTQVVWSSTTSLGCASVQCNTGGTFIVCSYNPPGNYVGQKPY